MQNLPEDQNSPFQKGLIERGNSEDSYHVSLPTYYIWRTKITRLVHAVTLQWVQITCLLISGKTVWPLEDKQASMKVINISKEEINEPWLEKLGNEETDKSIGKAGVAANMNFQRPLIEQLNPKRAFQILKQHQDSVFYKIVCKRVDGTS